MRDGKPKDGPRTETWDLRLCTLPRHPHPRLLPLQYQGLRVACGRLDPDGERLDRLRHRFDWDFGATDLLGLHFVGIIALLTPLGRRAIDDDLPLLCPGHTIQRILARSHPYSSHAERH